MDQQEVIMGDVDLANILLTYRFISLIWELIRNTQDFLRKQQSRTTWLLLFFLNQCCPHLGVQPGIYCSQHLFYPKEINHLDKFIKKIYSSTTYLINSSWLKRLQFKIYRQVFKPSDLKFKIFFLLHTCTLIKYKASILWSMLHNANFFLLQIYWKQFLLYYSIRTKF